MLKQAAQILQQVYGYDSFRKGQEEIISTVLQGRDTLAILPTGAGKSVCYQIPALLLPGTTLVISPLISLMKDQVDNLRRVGVSCAYLNSSLTAAEYSNTLSEAIAGHYKLLYIAPERLDAPLFLQLLERLAIPLIAIDEAHCVSQWGHDFRPSYKQLSERIASLTTRPRLACFTATATPEVAEDIVAMMKLREPATFVTGFERPNLRLAVVNPNDKAIYLKQYVQNRPQQSGIIYAATRKETDTVQHMLMRLGVKCGKYHGGMSDRDREEVQEQFRFGDLDVIVATNAFGMGIDKPDVRYVIHWQMPADIESYYQEAGRAGRDGDQSDCILLFNPADIRIQRFLIEQSMTDEERKSVAQANLNIMINYCLTEKCLQQFIGQYFGQLDVASCSTCSNCLDESESINRTVEAKMALSCVGRMRGRFGVTMVAKVLRGSRERKVLDTKLDQLSTYGLLRHWAEKEVTDWLYWLIAEGYMRLSDGQYPTVTLTAESLPILEGKQDVYQRVSATTVKQTSKSTVASPMFELLRHWRKQKAAAEQVPPFVIFTDVTLRELALSKPSSLEQLLLVKGIGHAKATKYGEELLAMFGNDTGDTSEQTDHIDDVDGTETKNEAASHQVTFRMFEQGLEIQAIAQLRGLSQTTIEAHLIRVLEEGEQFDVSRILDKETFQVIAQVINEQDYEKLREIKEKLPEQITYFQIRVVIYLIKKK
ncbi:DNA helicase RecQ [Paenibacillus yanchengensis]|uniref:DNA helicase RecQ n=1 Tax=Paenibacillus yanchengensis TaxID=2035833 RepID=A0ABW4YLW6_9BACL